MSLKYIFYTEFAINIPSFILCLFFPVLFTVQLTGMEGSLLSSDLVRWYGVVLFVLTFILGKALYEMDIRTLKTILSGYAIGDIMQIVVTWKLASHIGGWNFSLVFTAVLSLILFTARIAALQDERRLGFGSASDHTN